MTIQPTTFHPASLDWHRIGAFSTTLAAHTAALLLILLPFMAPQAVREPTRAIEVNFVEAIKPPPPLPPPPEMQPLPKPVKTPPVVTPPRPRPVPVSPVEVPSAPTIAAEPVTNATTDIAPPTVPVAPSGETRQLTYDGALRTRYPAPSIRAREQGTVLLRVRVDADGRVERVEIARSSGYSRLDAAARDSVRVARFRPVLVAGKATPSWGLVPIEFRLDHD